MKKSSPDLTSRFAPHPASLVTQSNISSSNNHCSQENKLNKKGKHDTFFSENFFLSKHSSNTFLFPPFSVPPSVTHFLYERKKGNKQWQRINNKGLNCCHNNAGKNISNCSRTIPAHYEKGGQSVKGVKEWRVLSLHSVSEKVTLLQSRRVVSVSEDDLLHSS